jgi:RNA polymerase sigma-70 factor (ECF subfamily)
MKTGDPTDAKDAFQETLVAAWQSLPRLRHPDRFWSWLVGISINKSIDVHRQRTRHQSSSVGDTSVEGGFAAAEVGIVLQELPPSLRDVLLLRYLLGLSERETARVLGTNIGTVKSRSARARARLLQSLQSTNTSS